MKRSGFWAGVERTAYNVGRVMQAFRASSLPAPSVSAMFPDTIARDDEDEEIVTPTMAASLIPTVYGCIDLLKVNVAKYPLRFYIGDPDGDRKEVEFEEGNIVALFRSPNEYDTGFSFVERIAASLDTNGNAFVWLVQSGTLIRRMYVLPAHRVEVKSGPNFGASGYVLHYGGRQQAFTTDEILHLRYWSPNPGPLGLAPMSAASLSYRTQRLAQRWQHAIYLRGGDAGGVYTSDRATSGAKRERFELQVRQRHQRPENAGRAIFLPPGVKREQTMLTPEQMKLIESYKLAKSDLFEVFGIPPWMKGLKEGAGIGSGKTGAEVDERLFTDNAVEPRQTRIADGITHGLLRFIARGLHCEFDLSGAYSRQLVFAQTAKAAKEALGVPATTVNEWRTKMHLAPFPDAKYDLPPEPVAPAAGPGSGTSDEDPEPKAGEKEKGRRADPPAISEADRERIDAELARFERRVQQAWLRLFAAQEERVGSALAAGNRAAREFTLTETELHDALAWTEEELRFIMSVFEFILATQGEAALVALGLKLEYDLNRANAAEFVRRHAERALTNTTETTKAALREKLAEVTGKGGGLSEAAAVVHEVFDNRRANALTIARTETAPAFNYATWTAWVQSEVVTGKKWVTIMDGHARKPHEEADGQEVALVEHFRVDGEALLFPGDPDGSPGNVINCRCGMLSVRQGTGAAAKLAAWLRRGLPLTNGHGKMNDRLRGFLSTNGSRS